MAFLWWDSFDGYAQADLGLVYEGNTGTMTLGAFGRFGTNGIRFFGNNTYVMHKVIAGSPATVGASFGFRTSVPGTGCLILHFWENANKHVELQMDSTGVMKCYRGTSGALLATGTFHFLANTYYHVEIKVLINNGAGTIETKVNGVTDINASGLLTRGTGSTNSFVERVKIGPEVNSGFGTSYDIDDLIIWDTSGSAPYNTWPGDCRIQCLTPTADGAHAQWTPSTGVNHYALVDEAAQNGDTDYNHDAVVGDRDTFTFSDLASTAADVLGVALVAVARKDDAGAKSLETTVRASATDYDTGVAHPLGSTYTYVRDQLTQNPDTAAAWTVTDVNALEAGVKVNA